jgi:hypothetical protein
MLVRVRPGYRKIHPLHEAWMAHLLCIRHVHAPHRSIGTSFGEFDIELILQSGNFSEVCSSRFNFFTSNDWRAVKLCSTACPSPFSTKTGCGSRSSGQASRAHSADRSLLRARAVLAASTSTSICLFTIESDLRMPDRQHVRVIPVGRPGFGRTDCDICALCVLELWLSPGLSRRTVIIANWSWEINTLSSGLLPCHGVTRSRLCGCINADPSRSSMRITLLSGRSSSRRSLTGYP